jgi:hypothetical protein
MPAMSNGSAPPPAPAQPPAQGIGISRTPQGPGSNLPVSKMVLVGCGGALALALAGVAVVAVVWSMDESSKHDSAWRRCNERCTKSFRHCTTATCQAQASACHASCDR